MSDDGRGYDLGRLMRGATRPIKRLGPMQFVVKGNEQPKYYVNLDLDTPCECTDAQMHGRPCLHEIAARLQNGDTGLVAALGDALLKAQKRNEVLEKRTEKKRTKREAAA
jgi:hypothetical protein